MEAWKLQKVQGIKDEVRELHPLLKSIFFNNPEINRFEYTHETTEMGADFILARLDKTLGAESFIGVIAKVGNISQDTSEIKRQIEECGVERHFDGGKKRIYLNEIWIVTNGTISNGAERKIHEDFRNRNVHFIQIEKLCDWTELFAKNFWSEISSELSQYLTNTLKDVNHLSGNTIFNVSGIEIEINQELRPVPNSDQNKIFRFKKSPTTSLENAAEHNKIIMIEGGMGSGKTTLLKKYVRYLCEPSIYAQRKRIPYYVDFKKISTPLKDGLNTILAKLLEIKIAEKPERFILIIDGIDEADSGNTDVVEIVKAIQLATAEHSSIHVVIGSRNYWSLEDGIELHKHVCRHQILALSFDQIYRVILSACKEIGLSERLREDLAKSNLLKSIPRTPLSAMLLSKVLSADAKEIPQTLPELYSKYVELALGRWDAGKGMVTEREYPIIISLLRRVAEFMLENRLNEIAISEIIGIFSEYIRTREGLPSAEILFEKIAQRSELIQVNTHAGTFKFAHPSFADYLLALHQKDNYGKAAPLTNPFNGRWLGVEYFYLGLIQDAGQRIQMLGNLVLEDEGQKMLRAAHFGNLMLAAHQTEYSNIEKAVSLVFTEAAQLFISISSGSTSSKLSNIPELRLLAMFTYLLKNSFEYDFFKKSLANAQLECQSDIGLSINVKHLTSFFIDSVRAGLGEKDIYNFLTTSDFQSISWAVKLGISHMIKDEELRFEQTDKFLKKILKSQKGNLNLRKFIGSLYDKSIKDIVQPIEQLESSKNNKAGTR